MTFSTFSVKVGTTKQRKTRLRIATPNPSTTAGSQIGQYPMPARSARDQLVIRRQSTVHHRAGKQRRHRQRVRLHGRHKISEHPQHLRRIQPLFGKRRSNPAKLMMPAREADARMKIRARSLKTYQNSVRLIGFDS